MFRAEMVFLAYLALVGCGGSELAPHTAQLNVRWFGSVHAIMHDRATEPRVALVDVVPGPHAFAVGALSELRGEVTVIDDVIWLAYASDEGTARLERVESSDERATLLLVANVPRWRAIALDRDVAATDLDDVIDANARANGVDPNEPFAFRIEGRVRSLEWHVVDGRRSTHGSHASEGHARRDVRASIVGFFSRHHEGVFTHHGSHTHMHVVLDDPLASGHVDRLELARDARLLLPE